MPMQTFLIILAGIILLYLIVTYNILIRLRNEVKNAWSQIDVQLKRRHDLIPNLVETAKGYMKHERETLVQVTAARDAAAWSAGIAEGIPLENRLNHAMYDFFAVAEDYPELRADETFLLLQEELASTEDKIAFARQSYNDQVLFYNNKIQMFPSNIAARVFGFLSWDLFKLDSEEERENVKIRM